ncbi:MAG TPA: protein kinase [Kofleriaceae bacterium]|nr:protein kinase [Kofleriaceae bacterium]
MIGQYRIVSSIGSGGMGTVYVGEHTLIGRRAAIKVLNPELSIQREIVDRFFNEARAAAAVKHSGIVQIFDFGFATDGRAYLVMELLEGWSLATLLREAGALPVVDALRVIRQVAWSIASVHAAGVIHRDLKPDNIFLIRDPDAIGGVRVKILDFGIAKLGDAFEPSRTQAGGVFGTPLYMAPEQFAGNVDERSDVYAVGCVMFETLVGKPPFGGETIVELGFAHTFSAPPVPSILRPSISPDIDATVLGCLAKDPAQRFPSMAALADTIDAHLARHLIIPPTAPRELLRPSSNEDASLPPQDPADRPGNNPPTTPRTLLGTAFTPSARISSALRSVLSLTPSSPGPGAPDVADVSPLATAPPAVVVPTTPSAALQHLPSIMAPSAELRASTPVPTSAPDAQVDPPPIPAFPLVEPVRLGTPGATILRAPSEAAPSSMPTLTMPAGSWGSEASFAPPVPYAPEAPLSAREIRRPPKRSRRLIIDEHERAAREFTEVFQTAVPAAFSDSLGFLIKFFSELFSTARKFSDQVIQLGSPAIPDLALREHYVLFVDDLDEATVSSADRRPIAKPMDAPNGLRALKTTAFRASVAPLAEQLATLGSPPHSVVIAILAAPQLGQGARETIFALRKEQKLFVVPIAATEIRHACDAGNERLLLINRIADLHTVSDPFAVLEAFTDPTRCIGFATEVGDLVTHITAGGKIVSVAGPPGSGKTSVVAMAEYGCDTASVTRRFIRLPCNELISCDPATLIRELQQRIGRIEDDHQDNNAGDPPRAATPLEPSSIPDMRTVIMYLGVRPPPGDGDARWTGDASKYPRQEQLVIVLEDADWLIRLASNSEPNTTLRESARELWRGLAQLCSSCGHTVIVTSVRDFQEQVPLEREVAAARVPLRALNRRESERLVTSLGELVGFSPTRRALGHLHRESGGNVYALRLLCSNVLRAMRERPGYSPLARLKVTAGMVQDAATQIAATGSSFRSHVSVWLDDVEKVVLQLVARERPRSPRRIRKALEGTAERSQIDRALDGLELMGLVESHARYRVRIRAFERWINTHLDPPPRRQYAIKQTWVTRIALACTTAALLLGAHLAWLRSTRSAEGASVDRCSFELDYPDRIGTEETFELLAYQHCSAAEHHQLAIEPVLSSMRITPGASNCTQTTASCMAIFDAVAGKQAHDAYQVQLLVDGKPLTSGSIAKDRFAFVRSIGETTVPQIAWMLPLLSVFTMFHKDLKRFVVQLLQLFGIGGGLPAKPPSEASTVAPTEPSNT